MINYCPDVSKNGNSVYIVYLSRLNSNILKFASNPVCALTLCMTKYGVKCLYRPNYMYF